MRIHSAAGLAVLFAFVLMVATSQALLTDGWRRVSDPIATGKHREPRAISCVSLSSCVVIGQRDGRAVAAQWNGAQWATRSLPGSASAFYTDLACASGSSCIAIDAHGGSARWDGTIWRSDPMPQPALAVSCPTSRDCVAVGGSGLPGAPPAAERWDGTAWTAMEVAGPASTTFTDVACSAVRNCIAVGYAVTGPPVYKANRPTSTVIEHWDGANWSVMPSPNAHGALANLLSAVACPAPTSCEAVGYDIDAANVGTSKASRPLILRLNAGHWALQSVPGLLAKRELTDVSCSSPAACTAVGRRQVSRTTLPSMLTLTYRWNGRAWSRAAVIDPGRKTGASELTGVACPTAAGCVAIGHATRPARRDVAFADRWRATRRH